MISGTGSLADQPGHLTERRPSRPSPPADWPDPGPAPEPPTPGQVPSASVLGGEGAGDTPPSCPVSAACDPFRLGRVTPAQELSSAK